MSSQYAASDYDGCAVVSVLTTNQKMSLSNADWLSLICP